MGEQCRLHSQFASAHLWDLHICPFLVISKTYPQADYGAVTAVNFHSSCSTGVKTPHFQKVIMSFTI